MKKKKKKKFTLHDGSRIAVVGGGPAGSFFTFFAYELAARLNLKIEIDIYEFKNFAETGPSGCNHCGGIVSESLVQMLKSDGIILPPQVIRRGIESYTLHLEHGSTVIETHLKEQRIVSMFRGSGPTGATITSQRSFDGYLLELCESKGARILQEKVTDLKTSPDQMTVISNKSKREYDLIVGATGLNPRSVNLFKKIVPNFIPPETTRTFIAEYYLETEKITRHFGNSMHVFLLNLSGIKFGALIPKGSYVTLVLLGNEIKEEMVQRFLNSETVKTCFPEGTELKPINPCQCFPTINIKNAKNPYANRIVLIGDSASSKLYKNGIGAAYITAKAAAETALKKGISQKKFHRFYQPECSKLDKDNAVGKLIFYTTTIIQKSSFLKKTLFKMVVEEQEKERGKREMSTLLWDTFTGSAPYRNILLRTLNPLILARLFWNIVLVIYGAGKK
ncbi:MAG: hypothetical protein WAO52_17050 [Prolixibacteraceae bacterium]